MAKVNYKREKACDYAKKWALSRNPKYYNFDNIGGDCTNFISQCIYAGSNVMNYTKDIGWYYSNANNKSPSWTGVEFLYKFLVGNKKLGPYGREVNSEDVELGDIVQLSFDGNKFEHSLIIVNIEKINQKKKIKIAAHTYDTFNKLIDEYQYQKIRFIHIDGVLV